MDRIDMTFRVERIDPSCLLTAGSEECSDVVRGRVTSAREVAGPGGLRSRLSGVALLRECGLDARTRHVVEGAARRHRLSGRGVTRLLRVARTIADLSASERVLEEHILEASCYRLLN